MTPFGKSFVAVVALSVVAAIGAAAWACSCIVPPPPKASLAAAAAVFSGKVTAIALDEKNAVKVVTLKVDRQWKGIEAGEVTVKTESSGAACGFGFKQDESYLVYCSLDPQTKVLWVSLCSRTATLKAAKDDLVELGPGMAVPAKP